MGVMGVRAARRHSQRFRFPANPFVFYLILLIAIVGGSAVIFINYAIMNQPAGQYYYRENLVPNPGFEIDTNKDKFPDSWLIYNSNPGVTRKLSEKEVYYGNKSMQISVPEAARQTQYPYGIKSQEIAVEYNQLYRFKAAVKPLNVEGKFYLTVRCGSDTSQKEVITKNNTIAGTANWIVLYFTMETGQVRSCRLILTFAKNSTGTVWLDSARFTKLTEGFARWIEGGETIRIGDYSLQVIGGNRDYVYMVMKKNGAIVDSGIKKIREILEDEEVVARVLNITLVAGQDRIKVRVGISGLGAEDISCSLTGVVCGADGKTYMNECKLKEAGVKKAFNGYCGPSPSCTDTDDGKKYYVKGYVNITGYGWDYCMQDGRLAEQFCYPEGYPGTIAYTCPNGCKSGACVRNVTACPETYAPVCGTDGITYENECVLKASGVGKAHDGPCADDFNVIVVGWDGVQLDHFLQCYNKQLPECSNGLPNLKALSDGRIYHFIVTSGATSTKAGWAQILSGYNAEMTGVFSNSDYQPIPKGYTVFEKAESYLGNSNIYTVFLSGKHYHTGGACVGDFDPERKHPNYIERKGQPWCNAKKVMDYYENNLGANADVTEKALQIIETHRNEKMLAFVHFTMPDITGHSKGENSPEYTSQLIDDDTQLGLIVDKLKQLGIYDRTFVYVVTDHGFDENANSHENAPFGFVASNDPLIMRNGDRKDLAPTILEKYGISTGKMGDIPAVNGYSLYRLPPVSCVKAGGSHIDTLGYPQCCTGLDFISLNSVATSDSSGCLSSSGGDGDNSGWCLNCGDDRCDYPENICNCPADCHQITQLDSSLEYDDLP